MLCWHKVLCMYVCEYLLVFQDDKVNNCGVLTLGQTKKAQKRYTKLIFTTGKHYCILIMNVRWNQQSH